MKLRAPTRLDVVVGIVFLVLNIIDAWLTLHAMHRFPGHMHEVNPLMKAAMAHSDGLFWAVKIFIPVLISTVTSVIVVPRRAAAFILGGSALLALVLISNIVQYIYALCTI